MAVPVAVATQPTLNVAAVFQQHCVACHGADRLDCTSPALLPENLGRLRQPKAMQVIREGRTAIQMLGFGNVLNDAEMELWRMLPN